MFIKIFSAPKIKYKNVDTCFYTFFENATLSADIIRWYYPLILSADIIRWYYPLILFIDIIVSFVVDGFYCRRWQYIREMATAETDFILLDNKMNVKQFYYNLQRFILCNLGNGKTNNSGRAIARRIIQDVRLPGG